MISCSIDGTASGANTSCGHYVAHLKKEARSRFRAPPVSPPCGTCAHTFPRGAGAVGSLQRRQGGPLRGDAPRPRVHVLLPPPRLSWTRPARSPQRWPARRSPGLAKRCMSPRGPRRGPALDGHSTYFSDRVVTSGSDGMPPRRDCHPSSPRLGHGVVVRDGSCSWILRPTGTVAASDARFAVIAVSSELSDAGRPSAPTDSTHMGAL